MSPGTTYDRVYGALKQQLLERAFRPGERLDPALLGEELHSSVTPVRSALHTLVGERLVEARTSDGFHVPSVDGPGLRDLYRWSNEVLLLVIRAGAPADLTIEPDQMAGPSSAASAIAALFAEIVRTSTNLEHRRVVASLNDRLHAARMAEMHVLTGLDEEISDLRDSSLPAARHLRIWVNRYHRRRIKAADAIVRTLYRNGAPI